MRSEVKKYERKVKTPEQALSSLMYMCARSEKSSGDAMRLMGRWGVEPEARKGVLERLIKERFIDDSRYAAAFVKDKVRFSGWGAYKIRMALVNKGVSKDVIDGALAEYTDRGTMNKRLESLLVAKKAKIKGGTPYEIKGKLMRYGLSLGYEYESVAGAVEEMIKEE